MDSRPQLKINLEAISHNARFLVSLLAKENARLWGVTKVVSGDPAIGRILLEAGCHGLAESRLENLRRLKDDLDSFNSMLIRPPGLGFVEDVARVCQVSLQSELEMIRLLDSCAKKDGKTHNVILMIELGDLREGVNPDEVLPMITQIVGLKGINLQGLGCSLTCLAGVAPSHENLGKLLQIVQVARDNLGLELPFVSAGSTNTLPMLLAGDMPGGINDYRVGEGIMLGMDVLTRRPLDGFRQDTFELETEIIELKTKPSAPTGEIAQDAFGSHPHFEDRGMRKRAIVNIGRLDADPELITPLNQGVIVLGASSDHTVLDVEDAPGLSLGRKLRFRPGYGALLRLYSSKYVNKVYL
jgi:predicted amino acid racemase